MKKKNLLSITLEQQFSQITISQQSPKKLDLITQTLNEIDNQMLFEFDSEFEENVNQVDINDSDDENEDENNEEIDVSDYVNNLIENESIFFIFNENEK